MQIGTLTRLGDSTAIVVPRTYMRQLGWITGNKLALVIDGQQLVLKNLEDYIIATRKTTDARGFGKLRSVTRRTALPKD